MEFIYIALMQCHLDLAFSIILTYLGNDFRHVYLQYEYENDFKRATYLTLDHDIVREMDGNMQYLTILKQTQDSLEIHISMMYFSH